MAQRTGSSKRKTRSQMTKSARRKGKISISRYFQTFEIGDKVALAVEPAVQKGLYFRRFHGQIGQITGKQGRCYEVAVNDRKKHKTLIVHPVHLKRV